MNTMTTKEATERYGINRKTVYNMTAHGTFKKALDQRGNKTLLDRDACDAYWAEKHPNWKRPKTRAPWGSKKKSAVIQMSLDSPLGSSSEQANTGYMPIAQVAELLKAMAKS